jgi:hypothetical protein
MTTIQVTDELQGELKKRKLYDKETYEEVIWGLIEDSLELSEETRQEICEAQEDVKAGRVHTLSQVKRELGL